MVRSAPQERLPWPISIFFGVFYTTNYHTSVLQIWRDSLHRLRSYCWETARRSIRPSFSMHPVAKLCVRSKNGWHLFWWARKLYHRAKFGEDRTTRAGCRCENMVFVCFFFTWRMPRGGKLPALHLLTGQKSGFSHRRRDSLNPFMSNLAGPMGTCVRLAVQNSTSIATGGGNAAPKISKISTFW